MKFKFYLTVFLIFAVAGSVFGQNPRNRGLAIKPFGKTEEGKDVLAYELTNANGVRAVILNFGGVIHSLEVPDRNGRFENVSLNFETVPEYQKTRCLLGSLVGRHANRIAFGEFVIDGISYKVYPYNGKTSIHGGKIGFDQVVWKSKSFVNKDRLGVILEYTAQDGEEGFPGNLKTTVQYSLTDKNELIIDYDAETDKPTPINLTNHCYWNLSGALSGSILDHLMQSPATHYLQSDAGLIPTGTILPVEGSPLDFRQAKTFGRDKAKITAPQYRGGYDHSLLLVPFSDKIGQLRPGASITDPKTGRKLDIFTTEPVVHLYTANGLRAQRGEHQYQPFDAFCIECQHCPDSPHHPNFPNAILRPGEKYHQTTVFQFSTKK